MTVASMGTLILTGNGMWLVLKGFLTFPVTDWSLEL